MSRGAADYNYREYFTHSDEHTDDEPLTRAQAALQERIEFRNAFFGDPEEFKNEFATEASLQYVRQIREQHHNREFLEFARRCHENEPVPDQEMLKFLADPRRIGVEHETAIKTYAGASDLTAPERREFYRVLDSGFRTVEERSYKADAPEEYREVVRTLAFDAAVRYCLDANENDSVPLLEHQDPAVAASFNQLMQYRIDHYSLMTRENGLETLADFINRSAAEVREANFTETLPEWFNAEKHVLEPELAQMATTSCIPNPST